MTHRIGLFLLTLAVAALPAAAQLPDSPTGRGGNLLIKLFQQGSGDISDDFMQATFSEEYLAGSSLAERTVSLRQSVDRIGPLKLRGVEKTGPFSATIEALSTLTGVEVEIAYEVGDSDPHPIIELAIEERDASSRESLTQEEMIARAIDYLHELPTDEFSGAVLIARGEEVLVAEARGLASRRYQVPNTMETRFNLGSINKIFTKIAVAQLARRGKLDPEATVDIYLPKYPNPDVAGRITVQQVVDHTAGLGEIFTEEFAKSAKETFERPRDYFRLFAQDPPLFEPGTSQRYSNGGYMVLGAIVEAISGQTYDEFVQENIFDVAGMAASGSFAMNDPVADLAMGYTRHGGEGDGDHHHGETDSDANPPWHENSSMIPFSGTPAGGGYSTAGDLLRFRHALVGHQLLDARYTEWIFTGKLSVGEPQASGGLAIGVAGGAPGVNAVLEIGDEFTLVVLSNLDPPSAQEVNRHLRDLVESVE